MMSVGLCKLVNKKSLPNESRNFSNACCIICQASQILSKFFLACGQRSNKLLLSYYVQDSPIKLSEGWGLVGFVGQLSQKILDLKVCGPAGVQ